MDELIKELSKTPTNLKEEEVQTSQEIETPVEETTQVEDVVEEVPIGNAFQDKETNEAKDTVPLAAFLDLKRELRELKQSRAEMVTTANVDKPTDGELDQLSQKYDVDQSFISDLYQTIEKKIESKYTPLIQKQELERKEEEKNRMFDSLYDNFIKSNPDYNGLINKNVVKKLAFDPDNASKKLSEIIKDAYKIPEKTEPQRDSFESSLPKGKTVEKNFANPSRELLEEMQSNPKLREEYGNWLTKNMMW